MGWIDDGMGFRSCTAKMNKHFHIAVTFYFDLDISYCLISIFMLYVIATTSYNNLLSSLVSCVRITNWCEHEGISSQ